MQGPGTIGSTGTIDTLDTIGIIGLGIMGGMMAETLRQQGYDVTGCDPAPAARKRLAQCGGRPLVSAAAVAASSDIIIVSLASSAALAAVTQELLSALPSVGTAARAGTAGKPGSHQSGPDGKPSGKPGGKSGGKSGPAPRIVIETSTLPIADKEAAAAALKRAGIIMLDCPISGTAARMKERAWTIFLSGERAACKRVVPVLKAFTDNLPYTGAFGNGSKLKFAANHLVAIYNVAYAESVTLARKMGLDPRAMLKVFGSSAVLGTGVMRLRMPFMVERKYAPPTMKVEVWQKDMQVIGDMARSVNCPTPLFSACVPIYNAAMAQGLALQDTASTAEVLGAMAGIPAAKNSSGASRARSNRRR